MGGRGAYGGTNKAGNRYRSQCYSVTTIGNVKFVSGNSRQSEFLIETMTRGKVYAHVEGSDFKSIVYFDFEGKMSKRIDLDHTHDEKKLHAHYGYEFEKGAHDASGLTLGSGRWWNASPACGKMKAADDRIVGRLRLD